MKRSVAAFVGTNRSDIGDKLRVNKLIPDTSDRLFIHAGNDMI